MGRTHKHCNKCSEGADLAQIPVEYHTVNTNRTSPFDGSILRLNVVKISSGSGRRDVLFIHGYPHAWPLWKNQLASSELAANYNLYAMDVRGFGQSENPGPGTASDCPATTTFNANVIADDIYNVITQLGLVNPIVVVHSLAGPLLANFIRKYGDTGTGGVGGACVKSTSGGPALGGIVLTATFPAADGQYFSDATLALLGSGGFFTDNLGALIPTIKEFATLSTFCTLNRSDFADVVQMDMTNDLDARIGVLTIGPPADGNVPVWQSVTVPTLIIEGKKDAVLNPTASATLARLIPSATFIPLKCVGHTPQLEVGDKYNRILENFLDQLPPVNGSRNTRSAKKVVAKVETKAVLTAAPKAVVKVATKPANKAVNKW